MLSRNRQIDQCKVRKTARNTERLGNLEQLESRCLLNARRLWTITGDGNPQDPADEIIIDRQPDQPTNLRAIVNGQIIGVRPERKIAGIRIFGGEGSDSIRVDETLGAIYKPITVIAGNGDDVVATGSGRDSLDGGDGADSLNGGDGKDRLRGGFGANRLEGGGGSDDIHGGPSDDTIWGGSGDDRIDGLAGRDRVQGGDGIDTLLGGLGNDTLIGHGDDPATGSGTLSVRQANLGDASTDDGDVLDGGAGDNVLVTEDDGDVSQHGRPPESLEHVGSCTEVADQLIAQAQKQYDWYFNGGWGRPGGGIAIPLDDVRAQTFAAELAGSGRVSDSTTAPATNSTFSNTNTQEQGVDEADIVKTNGNYMYVLRGGELIVVSALPVDDASVLSRTAVDGSAMDMFLRGNRVLIFSMVYAPNPLPVEPAIEPQFRLAMPIWYGGTPQLKITVFDVTDPTAPALVNETTLDGSYINARMVDGNVYLVLNNSPRLPIPWIVYSEDGTDVESPDNFKQRLINSDPESLLPHYHSIDYSDSGSTEQSGDLIVDCDGVYKTPGDDWMSLTTVLSFDLDADTIGGPTDSATVFGSIGTVYASTDNLYLINQAWHDSGSVAGIHKLSLGDDLRVEASGEVPGYVLNQFSLDEQGAYFRIATTQQSWDPATGRSQTSNAVYVMSQEGDHLNVVGSLEDLAPNEQIYGARFFDDHGFVVTFRQVDPLFALDLSNPTDPKVAGELKVSGYSRYLHPVDDNHLLAIGRDADESGRVRGLQVSLFDVSDLNHPTLVDQYLIQPEGGWNWSAAEWDHHAFSYFPESAVLAIPVEGSVQVDSTDPTAGATWRYESDFWVFHVDVSQGLDLLGQVNHDSMALRSLRINDSLYTLATNDIKIQPLLDPTHTTNQVSLA